MRIETSKWIGQYLFGHDDPPVSVKLPITFEEKQNKLQSIFSEPIPRYKNVDFFGYYQFHASNFAPYKDYFRSLFTPIPEIKAEMEKGLVELLSRGKTIVGLHIRRGDYKQYEATDKKNIFFIAPTGWYKNWLSSIWGTLDDPVLFIACEEIDVIAPEFSEYHPVIAKDIYRSFPEANFFPDYYLLSQCDIMAISNSTFSFTAGMLNRKARLFLRPDIEARKLISYDPWASPPLLNRIRSYY